MNDIKHTVYLHGYLGDTFTRDPIVLYARDIRDLVRGLTCAFGATFLSEIRKDSWHVSKGKRTTDSDLPSEEDTFLTEDTSGFPLKEEEVHIYPRVEGNITISLLSSLAGTLGFGTAGTVTATGAVIGGSGLAGSIGTLGVSLGSTIGVTTATATTILNVGLTLAATSALSAVIQAISSPNMDYDKAEVDRAASFLFNGVVNVVEQGGAVQLVYGKHLTGSTVISVNMVSEELGTITNELPPEDRNFLLPLSANWGSNAATIVTEVADGVGNILITKTALTGNHGDGQLLITTLERSTRYRLTVRYVVPYEGPYTRNDNTHTWAQYQQIYLQYRNNSTQIAGDSQHSVYGVLFGSPPPREFQFKLDFTTEATAIDEKFLFYSHPDTPAGTETRITFIKVEKR